MYNLLVFCHFGKTNIAKAVDNKFRFCYNGCNAEEAVSFL
jgi:hypothetical protein